MNINKEDIDIEYMQYTLAEYFENAGFANVYEREIKHYSDEQTIRVFKDTFGEDEPMYKREAVE